MFSTAICLCNLQIIGALVRRLMVSISFIFHNRNWERLKQKLVQETPSLPRLCMPQEGKRNIHLTNKAYFQCFRMTEGSWGRN